MVLRIWRNLKGAGYSVNLSHETMKVQQTQLFKKKLQEMKKEDGAASQSRVLERK